MILVKNHPKSEQNGALGSHGTPLGTYWTQRWAREGHQAPIRASMVAQKELKGRQRGLLEAKGGAKWSPRSKKGNKIGSQKRENHGQGKSFGFSSISALLGEPEP